MRLLLDTHVFLWWLDDDRRLAAACREAITDPANDCVISAASVWEIAIKTSIGRLRFPEENDVELDTLADRCGFDDLPITSQHAAAVRSLPFHHSDPFDRLLVAQATVERLTVVTTDAAFEAYGVATLPGG